MKQKVIVYKKVPAEVLAMLEKDYEVVYFERLDESNQADFLAELKNAHALLGADLPVNEELLNAAPQLKIVSNISVGYDNLDLPAMTERGVMATNTPDVLNDTTADTIFGLLLSAGRRLPELDQYVKTGKWKGSVEEEMFGFDVHHKILGIIGMGGIGGAIAKRAHLGFDMKILYHNRSRNEEAEKKYGAVYCGLDELLAKSDYVCLMTPLTPQTERMIGEREFNLMKPTAIFINGSRGKTIDEQALIHALQQQKIAAAGLDVFEQEPVNPDNPLLGMKNVVTLPHIGSATAETRTAMSRMAAESVIAALEGKCPPRILNEGAYKGS
ncbi:2-hydroxyacid dehydrogenase [Bacillus testis]|uniref:2-hydroxyacid dehydrogenase n=1 Tax=Bacillus testis TaxID=1622072 RepID=UPI00067E7528|nr:D-glycerate dehydrogenase [Bacillus testis]